MTGVTAAAGTVFVDWSAHEAVAETADTLGAGGVSHRRRSGRVADDGRHIGEPYQDGRPGRLRIYKGHFEDHVAYDDKRHDRDYKEKRLLTEATFGWAITAHKAQGSQWDNILLFDESSTFREDRAKHLYTGITRAAERITVII